VFLLDRMPAEPWAGLSRSYIERGWQRSWPSYNPASTLWRWRWPDASAAAMAPAARRLNFCFCDEPPRPGFENAVVLPRPGADDLDLRGAWPWEDDAFAFVRAHELLEHLPSPLHTMNELWRVLAPGATAEIAVPTTDGPGAFQDPTHVSFWNRRSFACFEPGAPERTRLVRRTSVRAAFSVVSERLEQTGDGPRLTLLLRAVKGQALLVETPAAEAPALPAPAAVVPPPRAAPAGDGRFLCALRVKDEGAYIGEVLERALSLCGSAIVLDDRSSDDTPAICRSFGPRVTVIDTPFTGIDEARDKNSLLQAVIAAAPAWVLWIDGDEVLERSGAERIRRAVRAQPAVAAFSLRIAYLWDRPDRERVDGLWGRFFRPSLFRLAGQPHASLAFRATHAGGNFHCGNVPHGLLGGVQQLGVRLKHYGYLERERRQAKYRWYNQVDPDNDLEDRYRHLAEIPGARHAPGPPRLVAWRE
jgi:SAM-dependent methyltransferase